MNEWNQLLRQTHPAFQPPPLVDDGTEIDWISPLVNLQDRIAAIPEKMAFKIGEVAELVGVKQYVLRYWESEFEGLHPKKSKNGQRMYCRKDVETAMLIRKLLHEDRFSIEGARAALSKLKKQMRDKDKAEPQSVEQPSTSGVSSACGVMDMGRATQDMLASAQAVLAAIRTARSRLT